MESSGWRIENTAERGSILCDSPEERKITERRGRITPSLHLAGRLERTLWVKGKEEGGEKKKREEKLKASVTVARRNQKDNILACIVVQGESADRANASMFSRGHHARLICIIP